MAMTTTTTTRKMFAQHFHSRPVGNNSCLHIISFSYVDVKLLAGNCLGLFLDSYINECFLFIYTYSMSSNSIQRRRIKKKTIKEIVDDTRVK